MPTIEVEVTAEQMRSYKLGQVIHVRQPGQKFTLSLIELGHVRQTFNTQIEAPSEARAIELWYSRDHHALIKVLPALVVVSPRDEENPASYRFDSPTNLRYFRVGVDGSVAPGA